MQNMGPHFEPHFSPYATSPIAPHANEYHAPTVPHIGDTMFKHYQSVTPQQPAAAAPNVPHTAQPNNTYVADATVTNITNHAMLRPGQKLKPGDVVEVNEHGRTELEYVNYNNQLRPLNEAVIHHVPNELRDHIRKVGGPSYFAHELHNRLPTQALYSQFKPSDSHGPNKPLI